MKVLITENQLERSVIKWLNSEYGNLESFETKEHPGYIFFIKDGQVIFDYNKKNGEVTISYNKIWSFLENFFGWGHFQIQRFTKEWVVEHYKLRVTRVQRIDGSQILWWKSITN